MKHLILFSVIVIGFLLLTLLSCYNRIEKIGEYYQTNVLNSNIYVKKSVIGGKYGRGIFANKDFAVDEIIEMSPYIEDSNDNFRGIMKDYIFGKDDKTSIVVFGYASLYNHADKPNSRWKITEDHFVIKAIKPIKKDEEIFISYGSNYWTSRENYIKKMDIEEENDDN